ncbi:unnamed protein product, partial [Musa acuminata subsp. burmannicoides]
MLKNSSRTLATSKKATRVTTSTNKTRSRADREPIRLQQRTKKENSITHRTERGEIVREEKHAQELIKRGKGSKRKRERGQKGRNRSSKERFLAEEARNIHRSSKEPIEKLGSPTVDEDTPKR